MIVQRLFCLALLLAASGCADTDPFEREGLWKIQGTNEANLRVMVASPADLARGVGDGTGDSAQATMAVERLRMDKVKALPASGIAQFNVSGSGGNNGGGSNGGSGASGGGSSGAGAGAAGGGQ